MGERERREPLTHSPVLPLSASRLLRARHEFAFVIDDVGLVDGAVSVALLIEAEDRPRDAGKVLEVLVQILGQFLRSVDLVALIACSMTRKASPPSRPHAIGRRAVLRRVVGDELLGSG